MTLYYRISGEAQYNPLPEHIQTLPDALDEIERTVFDLSTIRVYQKDQEHYLLLGLIVHEHQM